MSANDSNRDVPPEAESSHVGTIVLLGIAGLGVTWTYIIFGTEAFQWWAKGTATVVIFPTIFCAWRWRRQREQKQLEVLQRWADEDDARSQKRRRKPA